MKLILTTSLFSIEVLMSKCRLDYFDREKNFKLGPAFFKVLSSCFIHVNKNFPLKPRFNGPRHLVGPFLKFDGKNHTATVSDGIFRLLFSVTRTQNVRQNIHIFKMAAGKFEMLHSCCILKPYLFRLWKLKRKASIRRKNYTKC